MGHQNVDAHCHYQHFWYNKFRVLQVRKNGFLLTLQLSQGSQVISGKIDGSTTKLNIILKIKKFVTACLLLWAYPSFKKLLILVAHDTTVNILNINLIHLLTFDFKLYFKSLFNIDILLHNTLFHIIGPLAQLNYFYGITQAKTLIWYRTRRCFLVLLIRFLRYLSFVWIHFYYCK